MRRPVFVILLTLALFWACSDDPVGPGVLPEPEPPIPTAELEAMAVKSLPAGMTRGEANDLALESRTGAALSMLSVGPAAPLSWEANFGTALNQFDDDCDRIGIGFEFEFYGQNYSEIAINSNGNLTFWPTCNLDWWHPDIPDGYNIVIGPLYGDFNPQDGGDVYYQVLGAAPARRFVVTWAGVPEFPVVGSNTFQAILFEGSNDIQFGYAGLTTDGFNWAWLPPSTDPAMDVGIASGGDAFINSASGAAIPALDGTNLCYRYIGGTYEEVRGPCAVPVEVDIKPRGEPNSINCTNERGVIPVAILSTDAFDATSVDHTTVRFEGASEIHADRRSGNPRRHEEDVNGDSNPDLVFHFRLGDTELNCSAIEGSLDGRTFDGQLIRGADALVMVGEQLLRLSYTDPENDHLQFDPIRQMNPPSGVVDAIGVDFSFDGSTGEYEVLVTSSSENPFSGWVRVTLFLFNPDTGSTAWDPAFLRTFSDQYFSEPSTSFRFSGVDARLMQWDEGDRVALCEGTNYEELGPCVGGLGLPDGVSRFSSTVATYSGPPAPGAPKGVDLFHSAPAGVIGR